ncbi:hypothetical protein [Hymenobacter sp. GOD-10R]|uniref:hypothetical protein n=1 Tax=Hymenobacter sp. GOD-10R TaxID=3093922 RepID=UPI002D78331F|nr:hypothetical protein [Hymenobacter sp. GOD-10R]WRQ30318.1 hypothetical protein SD425_08605 [Hymenobacter sp. GOD-10R]
MKLIPAFLILALTWISLRTQPATSTATVARVPAWEKGGNAEVTSTNKALSSVTGYKAVNAGNTLNVQAVQTALHAASKRGGAVTFALGQYLTSPLFLQKGVRQASSLLEKLTIGAVTITSATARDWSFHNVNIKAETKEPVAVLNSTHEKP